VPESGGVPGKENKGPWVGVTTTTSLPDEPGPWLIFDKGDLGGSEYEERALPGIGRPFREPNPDFPPNHMLRAQIARTLRPTCIRRRDKRGQY
jgi:hypothetical protein